MCASRQTVFPQLPDPENFQEDPKSPAVGLFLLIRNLKINLVLFTLLRQKTIT
jgi:hypothetical protein